MVQKHCVKSVRIRSYSGPHFSAFGLNTERYSISLRIQSKCGNMRTRITPNKETFCAVKYKNHSFITVHIFVVSHFFVKIFCSEEFESKCKFNNFFLFTHSPWGMYRKLQYMGVKNVLSYKYIWLFNKRFHSPRCLFCVCWTEDCWSDDYCLIYIFPHLFE